MATPQVGGVAAVSRTLNPRLSAEQVLVLLKQSARRAGGYNGQLGWGILDSGAVAAAARPRALTPPRATPLVLARGDRALASWTTPDPASGELLPFRIPVVGLHY